MRVISGKAKGRRLIAPKGGAIRPTADRIKESLFNILPRDFSGMKILELFAGTGNISIEALSRGAESALLVDASDRSARIIRENLRRLELTDRAQMWVMPVRDRKSTRLNSSHMSISYAVFCLKKKKNHTHLLEHTASADKFLHLRYSLFSKPLSLELFPASISTGDQLDSAASTSLPSLAVVHS